MGGCAGKEDAWRHAALVFANALGDAGQFGRRGIAVAVGGIAQNQNDVKVLARGVGERREVAYQTGASQ